MPSHLLTRLLIFYECSISSVHILFNGLKNVAHVWYLIEKWNVFLSYAFEPMWETISCICRIFTFAPKFWLVHYKFSGHVFGVKVDTNPSRHEAFYGLIFVVISYHWVIRQNFWCYEVGKMDNTTKKEVIFRGNVNRCTDLTMPLHIRHMVNGILYTLSSWCGLFSHQWPWMTHVMPS
jgi:hypothetical protein